MSHIENLVSEDEKIVGEFKRHRSVWMGVWLSLILVPVTFGLSFLATIYYWFTLQGEEMGLTDKRLILRKGVLKPSIDEVDLSSVKSVRIEQTPTGRLLGYADVWVTGEDDREVMFDRLRDPLAVKKQIEATMSDLTGAI